MAHEKIQLTVFKQVTAEDFQCVCCVRWPIALDVDRANGKVRDVTYCQLQHCETVGSRSKNLFRLMWRDSGRKEFDLREG